MTTGIKDQLKSWLSDFLATNSKDAVELQQHLRSIQNGHQLKKVRRNGKTYQRFFRADDSLLSFSYIDSKKSFRKFRKSLKDHSTVNMTEVHDIREGAASDVFLKVQQKMKIPSDLCLSVVIGNKSETLDLIAPTKEVRDSWLIGLRQVKRALGEIDLATQEEIQIHQLFQGADKNGDAILTLKEAVTLFKQMNLTSDLEHARRLFQHEATAKVTNKKGEECLNYKEFVALYRKMTTMDEIKELFDKCARGGKFMDVLDLQDFFKKEQNEDKSRAECISLIKENEVSRSVAARENLSLNGFMALFKMPSMDIFSERCSMVYQDMTRPMSQYYINSSHNTYLAEDQLLGRSSVEMYIRSLKRGCRCVEIDCWNGDDSEPIVYHGHTLTSKILFRDVIAAINTYAFEASAFPVIVSLENHCNIEQQKVMANIMKQTFGDKIYTTPITSNTENLPSPESLRGRIIIKNKKLSVSKPVEGIEGDLSSDDDDDDDVGSQVSNMPEELARERKKREQDEKKKKLATELSDLVNICQSAGFKGFDYAQEHQKCYHISSIAEKKAMDLAEDHGPEWVRHNIRQLTRIYPAGTRTDSSNYFPVNLWLAGCQIVALNYQTSDDPMIINAGFFQDNGNCGYILKPQFMLNRETPFDARGDHPPEWKKTLSLTIISGYQLPLKKNESKDILDPMVEVEILGVPVDCSKKSTRYIDNNGFHPVWNETLQFELTVPDAAIVCFKVMDHENSSKDVLVACFAMPFRCMRQGYRTVHLQSKHGEEIRGSYLFVHVTVE